MQAEKLAVKLAEESIVLLKNEGGVLPLAPDKKIAVFGRAAYATYLSGNGSGAVRSEGNCNIITALKEAGQPVCKKLDIFYRTSRAEETDEREEFDFSKKEQLGNSGLMYEIFGTYHPPREEFQPPEDDMTAAAEETDTALYVLGRNAGGEECDRHLQGDYLLTESEQQLITKICRHFSQVILVLNSNGLVDLAWSEKYPSIKAMLFLGLPGEGGAEGLTHILQGRVSPSGKLSFTIAKRYDAYPSAQDFERDTFREHPMTVYREGIYNGYRYFVGKEKEEQYPFGYGISYTDFLTEQGTQNQNQRLSQQDAHGTLELLLQITNNGQMEGKEVVQIYIRPQFPCDRPEAELIAFAKTPLLAAGEKAAIEIAVPVSRLACYDAEQKQWILQKGEYFLTVGNARTQQSICKKLTVEENISIPSVEKRNLSEKTVRSFVKGLSDEQLAALLVGYGPGIPFAAYLDETLPETITDSCGEPLCCNDHPTGYSGYVSPAMPKKGIHSIRYMDGPAGLGETAWPTEMLLSCSFDTELLYQFGNAVGAECEKHQVDVWLAPAVNLHRNPLGGRNFEYFSEDPYLTGACAVAVVRGVQENHPVLACPKHFVANEQETYRRGSAKKHIDAIDSVVDERALRELYLKPFEMLVREGKIHCLMTSFNKVNGTFAAGNAWLCTEILRKEWGFEGYVVTDWGDMDIVVDGADAVAAGNDVIMPGGPPVIRQILEGKAKGRVSREQMELSLEHFLRTLGLLHKYDDRRE